MQILENTYDYNLVAISILVATLASYVAFDLISITWNEKERKNYHKWLIVSASVIGVGIWTMHFTGMFSYRLPIPAHYELAQTIISLIMAILGSYLGLLVIHKHHNILHQVLASILMGVGISGMHYTGMGAMNIQADMHYDSTLVLCSILIAISVSWVALQLFVKVHSRKISVTPQQKIFIAGIMGVAISGMHYTGMAATSFTAHNRTLAQAHGIMIEGNSVLAAIIFSSVLLIFTAIYLTKLKIGLTEQLVKELGLMRINERQLRSMIENAPDAFFIHDFKGKILDINKAAYQSLGYTDSELLASTIFDFEVDVDAEKQKNNIWPSLNHGESLFIHRTYKCKDGTQLPVDINLTCIKDDDESLIFALARDMTETEKLKAYLQKLAMTDELTETHNRRAFMDAFSKEMSRAKRAILDLEMARKKKKISNLSILMIDIDHFKEINDSYGHDVGDLALRYFVRQAKETLRNEDLIGRIGGEEFCVLLANTAPEDAHILAERLRETFENSSIEIKNYKIQYTISIGLASLPGKNTSPNLLLKNADTALYKAKENGRNRVEIFST